jgi:hypothetical protein
MGDGASRPGRCRVKMRTGGSSLISVDAGAELRVSAGRRARSGGLGLVGVELEQVVGGHDQPPLGSTGG